MKLAILSAAVGAACAFAPSQSFVTTSSSSLSMSTETEEDVTYSILSETAPAEPDFNPDQVNAADASPTPINGWVPDESLPCYGLPGAVAPTGFFDPLGFAQKGITLNEVKRNREAEVMHGRVA